MSNFQRSASRLNSKSPVGIHSRGNGVSLSINTNVGSTAALNGSASSFRPTSANQYLLNGSTPDDPSGPVIVNGSGLASSSKKPGPSPIGLTNGGTPTRQDAIFTTDMKPLKFVGGHYRKLMVDNGVKYDYLFRELGKQATSFIPALLNFFVTHDSDGKKVVVFMCFDDVKRAEKSDEMVNMIDSTADLDYIHHSDYAAAYKQWLAAHPGNPEVPTSYFDGQVMFYAKFDGPMTASKSDTIGHRVRALAASHGPILAFAELGSKGGVGRFRVEYNSISVARGAIGTTSTDLEGWTIETCEMPDASNASTSDRGSGVAGRGTPVLSSNGESADSWISPTGRTGWTIDRETGERLPLGGKRATRRPSPSDNKAVALRRQSTTPSPLGYGMQVANYGGQNGGLPNIQSLTSSFPPMGSGSLVPHQGRSNLADRSQAVDPFRIATGQDVRTTLMLRNLPNNTTCQDLRRNILNMSSFGEYDFSYLRMDYSEGKCVGYGFVNFISGDAVLRFVQFWSGKTWPVAGKPRMVAFSYAAVQSLDNCIEKFRNSSVMSEREDYKPKLWWASDSGIRKDLIGEEREFPGVNNESKHQRSLANATQIGLFPPQSRRGPGGAPRGGRSRYDRGTTAQQQEEMLHNLQLQMQAMQYPQPQPFAMPPMGYPVAPHVPMQMTPPQPGFGWYVAHPNMPPQMVMPPPQQQFHNGFGGYAPAHGPNQMQHGNGYSSNNAQHAVPRALSAADEAGEDPEGLDGDVNVAELTGYYNPHAEKAKAEAKQ